MAHCEQVGHTTSVLEKSEKEKNINARDVLKWWELRMERRRTSSDSLAVNFQSKN